MGVTGTEWAGLSPRGHGFPNDLLLQPAGKVNEALHVRSMWIQSGSAGALLAIDPGEKGH